jgi:transcriptional regulator with XRE-family HTH domain
MSIVYSKEYKQFLARLYQAREQANLTQIEVAQKLGKPQSFVAKCELGDRKVDAIDILKFAKIYKVSVEFFFEGIEV